MIAKFVGKNMKVYNSTLDNPRCPNLVESYKNTGLGVWANIMPNLNLACSDFFPD